MGAGVAGAMMSRYRGLIHNISAVSYLHLICLCWVVNCCEIVSSGEGSFVLGGELLRDRVEPRRQFSRNSLFNCDDQIFENVTENNKYKMQKKSDFGVSFSLL